jgi:hypothetical protein
MIMNNGVCMGIDRQMERVVIGEIKWTSIENMDIGQIDRQVTSVAVMNGKR